MIEITEKPVSPELVINKANTDSSGCITAYIGLILQYSRGEQVLLVECRDCRGGAADGLREIVDGASQKW